MRDPVTSLFILYLLSLGLINILGLPKEEPATVKNVIEASRNTSTPSKEQMFLDDTVRLITEGESEIKLNKAIKDVVLVVGMTGAGKTTITKFIAEAENLEAYKAGRLGILIRDTAKQISEGSTVISKTIFPNLIVDPSSNISFYDMPGFSDTRNVSVEIANSWFLKNVADHAERVKILFIITHTTMIQGGHRKKIIEILNHATEFIKNPGKFTDAISLVASKVDSDESPERIIGGIAAFLESVKTDLQKVMKDPKRREKADALLDAFLSKDENNSYNRISYFLQPVTPGPLIAQADVMERRAAILRNLEVSTTFVRNSANDFGISVSENGKFLISKIAGVMSRMISSAMLSLSNRIVTHTQSNLQDPSRTVGKLLNDQRRMENFYRSLSPAMTRQEFTQALYDLIRILNIPSLDQEIRTIQNREKNLNFFETVRGERFPANIPEWSSPLRIAIESANSALSKMTSTLNQHMLQETKNLNTYFQNKIHQQIFNSRNSTALKLQLSSLAKSLEDLLEDAENRIDTYNQFAARLRTFLGYQGEILRVSKIQNLTNDMDVEGPSCRVLSPLKVSNWLPPFETLLGFLEEEQVKVEKLILDETFLPVLSEDRLAKTRAEKNFTRLITEADHDLSLLRTQRDQDEKVFEAKMLKLEENCERDLTNTKSLHDNEEKGLIANGNTEEEIFKRELTLEKEHTGRVEENCVEAQNKLNGDLENLRQQHLQNFENKKQRRKDLSSNLKQQLDKQLEDKQASCVKEVDNKKLLCTQQQTDLQKHNAQQAQSLGKISRRINVCQEDVKVIQSICTQEVTKLKDQTETDKRVLQNKITAERANCVAQKKVDLEACDIQLEEARTDLSNEELRANKIISSKAEECQQNLDTKVALHQKDLEIRRKKLSSEKRFLEADCEGRVISVKTESLHEFEKQKEVFLERWRKSGSCCYSKAGKCRDGTNETSLCCSYKECTYRFWSSNCCGCASTCRM
ncbi:unnamed protein product [Allacma fusca]|uniref:Uncharacterized protein n=1 Tax=Allacma fusca TaxID=39272 RepID=A0A8J2NGU6_9HEXA|nr:unnamed protein product [Allacma fusca]